MNHWIFKKILIPGIFLIFQPHLTLPAKTLICSSSVPAYDLSDAKKRIGEFKPGSRLEIDGNEPAEGWVQVTYVQPDGNAIQAQCKKADLEKKPSSTPFSFSTNPRFKTDTSRWTTDYDKALVTAGDERKYLLLFFTESDVYTTYSKLLSEVFLKQEFLDYAREWLVLLTIDFPHRKNLPPLLIEQNRKLAEIHKVTTFPTLIVVDYHEHSLGKIEYIEGGPSEFLAVLDRIIHSPVPEKSKD